MFDFYLIKLKILLINLGDILLASDSLSRVLAQYDRLVKQDNYTKDGLLENIEFK